MSCERVEECEKEAGWTRAGRQSAAGKSCRKGNKRRGRRGRRQTFQRVASFPIPAAGVRPAPITSRRGRAIRQHNLSDGGAYWRRDARRTGFAPRHAIFNFGVRLH